MENVTLSKCQGGVILTKSEDGLTTPNSSTSAPVDDASNDALFYIITVLMFYACSIVILMIKYIRRERQEAEFNNFYYEYVSRDKFQNPQYQNLQYMKQIMKSVTCGRKVAPAEKDRTIEDGLKIKTDDDTINDDPSECEPCLSETPV